MEVCMQKTVHIGPRPMALARPGNDTPSAGQGQEEVHDPFELCAPRTAAGVVGDNGSSRSYPVAPTDGETSSLARQRGLVSSALYAVLLHDLGSDHSSRAAERRCAPSSVGEAALRGKDNGSCRQRRFISSTQELQLTAVWLSQDCRAMAGCHARIARGTPRRLWCPSATRRITRGERRRSGSLDGSPRLPRRRLTSVTWERTIRELGEAQEILAELENLELGRILDEKVDAVAWPSRIRRLVFDKHFNQPIDRVAWPPLLQSLEFGAWFDQAIQRVTWPASLQQLTFGSAFNQPIAGAMWPESLQHLSFGEAFNQAIDTADWPTNGPRSITFGSRFNRDLEGSALPGELEELTLACCFNKPIAEVKWPDSLKKLVLGTNFDQPIHGVVWPASLQQLSFGYSFNQPIEQVVWPACLQQLSFGCCFDQPVQAVAWPETLEVLEFGAAFYQPLDDVIWPASLKQLCLRRGLLDRGRARSGSYNVREL